jgi:hypothetical protein
VNAPLTNFGALLNVTGQAPDSYEGLTTLETAAAEGDYKKNRENIRKPWTLPILPRPGVKQIG